MNAKIGRSLAACAAAILAADLATAAVTRGPYLQTPTPGSMIVRWRTDTATTSRVAYGTAPGSLTSTVDDGTATTEHVVAVSGLTPDTQYYYSVGSVLGAFVGDDADHYFRTAPTAGPARSFRIWTIGDAGFTGPNLDAVRDAFKAYNGGSSATDLFLLLGDNAYLIANDAQYQAAVFDEHAEMLRTSPVWSTFGNHERFSSQDLTQTGPYFNLFSFPTAGEAGGVASGTEAYYSFDYANVHFVVLDSEDFTPTSASGPMLTWLTADLTATTADWVIAVWHRPPYSKGLFHDSDVEVNEINMRTYVLPVLESFGVDLVLCGHSHNYERSYLLDGHYGLSTTFTSANQVDAGDGDPSGDGSYRKPNLGPDPNQGAVYAVNGSGSEFRPATLNHPAHLVGLLEVGSMVIDVDGDTLTARFLTGIGAIDDQFQMVKGDGCPNSPATGCEAGLKGKLSLKNSVDDGKDKLRWKLKGGTIDSALVGTPTGETNLAACVYDQTGALVGGTVPQGAPEWAALSGGFAYNDPLATRHGFQKIRIKMGTGPKTEIQVKGRGAGLDVRALPAFFPVTAQLVNRDTGACWQSVFTTSRRNGSDKVTAVVP